MPQQNRRMRASLSIVPASLLLLGASPAAAQTPAPDEKSSGITIAAQPGKGVRFEDDGRFALQIRGRFQAQEAIAEDAGDVATEARIRRARLAIEGYLFDESLQYELQLGFGPGEAAAGSAVLDAYLNYSGHRDLELKAGQYKVPFDRANLTSSSALQFVDRASVVGELALDRDLGITLHSDDLFGQDGKFRYALGLFSGEGRGPVVAPGGFLWVARLEAQPLGSFDAYKEGDLARSVKPHFAIAGSIAFNQNAIRARSNRGTPFEVATLEGFEGFDFLQLEADTTFKWHGFSLLAEFLWRDARGDDAVFVATDGREIMPENSWGWLAQGGQMIGPHWEIVARYSEQLGLGRETNEDLLVRLADAGREAGAGINWYLHGHTLKVQADYFRRWGVESEGIPTRSFDDGINEVRLQLQAAF